MSEAARKIGAGTDSHGMSVIVTEIKTLQDGTMTTGGHGKTRTGISTDIDGTHHSGQIPGIRQRQTPRRLIRLRALYQANSASSVPITPSGVLIQTTAGDHLVPMPSSTTERHYNAAMRNPVALKEIVLLNSSRSHPPPHHRLPKCPRSGRYLTSHRSSTKAPQRLQKLARTPPPSHPANFLDNHRQHQKLNC